MIPTSLERIFYFPLVGLSGGTLTLAALLTSFAIVCAGYLGGIIAARTLHRVLAARGIATGVAFAASKITRYVITVLGVVVAAQSLGFNLSAVLTASAVLLVGIGLGLQQVAQNLVAGIILLVEQPVRKGDFVKVGQAYGVIQDIGLRSTHVMTRDEVVIIVPNSDLASSQVSNHSVPTTNVRLPVRVGVAYGSNVDLVRRVLTTVAEESPHVLRTPAPEVRFDDFGESSLAFSLLVWIANPAEDLRVASTLRFAIDAAFRRAQIEIPFPQRVVHLPPGVRQAS